MKTIFILLVSAWIMISTNIHACTQGASVTKRLVRGLSFTPTTAPLGQVYDATLQEDEDHFIQNLVIKTTENIALCIEWRSLFTPYTIATKVPLDIQSKPPSRRFTVLDTANKWMVLLFNDTKGDDNTIKFALYALTNEQ